MRVREIALSQALKNLNPRGGGAVSGSAEMCPRSLSDRDQKRRNGTGCRSLRHREPERQPGWRFLVGIGQPRQMQHDGAYPR